MTLGQGIALAGGLTATASARDAYLTERARPRGSICAA
jgi:protein involved in polysaccharide export with SLBB domain